MKTRIFVAMIALLCATEVVFAQKTVNKSFTGVKSIRMTTSSGNCEITKASGAAVEVEVRYSYDEGDWAPSFEQSGDRLMLSEDRKGNLQNSRIEWKIAVPDGVAINLKTGSGNIMASNLKVNFDLSSGSGDLEFENITGELDANTGSGNVDLTGFSGMLKANTGSGNMKISKADGEIDLNCGSGDIRVNDSKAIFAVNTGSGDVTADKITIAGSSMFNTGSGRARIVLAATPKFNLSVNSGSGDSELDFNGNEIAGQITMKANKRHGSISAPFAFDKTEEIESRNGNDATIVKTVSKGNSQAQIKVSTGSGNAIISK
jgi:Putative adhesin